jgi:O-antigen/teichoic acid export membrane protein
MADKKGLKQWLWERRNSTRLAYVLQLATRILTSFMSLVWIRLLVDAMGLEINGAYLAFQKLISLGGLGDLGMGAIVGIRSGQYLGQGRTRELQQFLASARIVFLILALVAAGVVLLFTPWLPRWFQLDQGAGTGSMRLLFAVGAVLVAGVVLSSYVGNLNYACGNVTWPVIPAFILFQCSMLGHWLLARQHLPLWIQCLPYVASSGAGLLLLRLYVRASHPAVAGVFPLKLDWRMAVSLTENSFWAYLCGLGNSIYRNTDGLVISAGFKPGTLPVYDYNYKFCEIAVFVAVTASFVSLPKITQWMASADRQDQDRVRKEARRLNQFQTMIGCAAALAYLAGNDLFMHVWRLHKENPIPPVSLPLQLAFALNMAVTAGGDAGLQMMLRSGKHGLRIGGGLVGLTGLLNLGLSILAMTRGSLLGIAMATVLAESVLRLASSFYTCRKLQIRWLPWAMRAWLVPVAGVLFAAWLRWKLPFDSAQNISLLIAAYLAMALGTAWMLGITPAFIKAELAIVRGFFRN